MSGDIRNEPNAEYLGDGVYASFDGFQVKLSTPEQVPYNEIYLENQTMVALQRYSEKMLRLPQGPQNGQGS